MSADNNVTPIRPDPPEPDQFDRIYDGLQVRP